MVHHSCTEPHRGHPLFALGNGILERAKQLRRRRKIKRLLDLDEKMLRDIGVTRGEVEIALQSPMSVDAATELRRMSLERRKRRM